MLVLIGNIMGDVIKRHYSLALSAYLDYLYHFCLSINSTAEVCKKQSILSPEKLSIGDVDTYIFSSNSLYIK